MDGDKMHRLTHALEPLRRLRQILEGVRVHELASLNGPNLQQYNNLLTDVETQLCIQGYRLTQWDALELLGYPPSALSFFYVEGSLSSEIRALTNLTLGQHDPWVDQFMRLVESLHEELHRRTGMLLVSEASDAEMTHFFNNNTLVCQRLGAVLRHVYDWQVPQTTPPHKEYIQSDTDWSDWFTACVWITTRTPDPTCHTLYTECVSTEKTLQQELQDNALKHFVDNKWHYEPKLPTPQPPRPDDMDIGGKMPSRHTTTMLSNSELLRGTPQSERTQRTSMHSLLQRLLASGV